MGQNEQNNVILGIVLFAWEIAYYKMKSFSHFYYLSMLLPSTLSQIMIEQRNPKQMLAPWSNTYKLKNWQKESMSVVDKLFSFTYSITNA